MGAKDDTDFSFIDTIGTSSPKLIAQDDPTRFKLTLQNTGTTNLTIGKSTPQKPLVAGQGIMLAGGSAIADGKGGAIEMATRDKLFAISSASGGQILALTERRSNA